MSKPLLASLLATALLAPTAAHADGLVLELGAAMGGSSSVTDDKGHGDVVGAVEVGARARVGDLALGVVADDGGAAFGPTHRHVAVVFGADRWMATIGRLGAQVRLQVLGEGGFHQVQGIGRDLFQSPSSEEDATLPFAGARVGVSLERSHVYVAAWLEARQDLDRTTRTVDVESCFIDCSGGPTDYTVGGRELTLGAGVGATF